jgi:hypothetical protein
MSGLEGSGKEKVKIFVSALTSSLWCRTAGVNSSPKTHWPGGTSAPTGPGMPGRGRDGAIWDVVLNFEPHRAKHPANFTMAAKIAMKTKLK